MFNNRLNGKALLAAAGLAVLTLAVPASAQTSNFQVRIPFSFVAGNHMVPAGQYNVTVDGDLARLRNLTGASITDHIVVLQPGATSRSSSNAEYGTLRFAKYGEKYFMTGVWKPGTTTGNGVTPSKRLLDSAQAKMKPEYQTIISESGAR